MAVAVKTSPGARSSTSGGLVLYSLVGVVYLVATIAIVFKFLPDLWWSVWEGLGGAQATVVGSSLLAILELAAAVGLLWGGARLLGRTPTAGVRAGVVVGFAGLIVVLLLTRWAGNWFESYVFDSRGMEPQTGAILTAVVGVLLLAIWAYAFTRPWTQGWLVKVEEGGWFHATIYKGNQGRMVRRGTIIGILLLVGTGIWSLMHSGMLRRGPSDWALAIPFTGRVAIEWMGNARDFVRDPDYVPPSAKTHVRITWVGDDKSKVRVEQVVTVAQYQELVNAALDRADKQVQEKLKKTQEQIEEVKNAERLDTAQLARLEKEATRWKREQDTLAKMREQLAEAAKKDPVDYLLAVNKAVYAEFETVVPKPDQADFESTPTHAGFHDDVRRRLYETSRQTTWDDLTKLLAAVKKEAETGKKTEEVGWLLSIPAAILVVDRAALQTANDTTKEYVIVGLKRNPDFRLPEGKMVKVSEFDEEEKRIYVAIASRPDRLGTGNSQDQKQLEQLTSDDVTNGTDFRKRLRELIEAAPNEQTKLKLRAIESEIANADDVGEKSIPGLVPRRETLARATGPVLYKEVPLLPAVQFTLPLLLLAGGIWFAWRMVNLPAFADFLIATEAEMNKVSWTTQKRLVQDTIVVLVTVVLMALFLFSMDVLWKKVLGWERIGVLHIPEDKSETKKSITDKKW